MVASSLRIVVLSGPLSSGRSSLASLLEERHRAVVLKTRAVIASVNARAASSRQGLQRAGDSLDREDGGKWISTALARLIEERERGAPGSNLFVVDSAKIPGQIAAIRNAFGPAVHHIHLTAQREELVKRYEARRALTGETSSYEELSKGKTERGSGSLADLADIVVETDRCSPECVLVRATALLNLYPRAVVPLVDVLVGGQYGSEGKGNIVGHIGTEYVLLVRVGGPNAGHQVYGNPIQKYYHLPSGTERAPHAQILLGAGAVIRVDKLLEEIQQHKVTTERLMIDPQAMIIEDQDIVDETKLAEKISSTKQGVGAASARKIMCRGEEGPSGIRLARDVKELQPFIRGDSQEILEKAYMRGERILLEGTQGTSLSLHHGKYPHVTSRDTTVAGCLAEAGISARRVRRIVMVCRTYPIRVGGPSGPMKQEISFDIIGERAGLAADDLKEKEKTTTTKKNRRVAEFDWEQLRRSVVLNTPTDIALTFVDYLGAENREAFRYEQLNLITRRFIEEVERVSGVPVSLISTKFDWRNVIDRRCW